MNQLKEAEKKATLLVEEARKGSSFAFMFFDQVLNVLTFTARVDRMKEAKTEAELILSVIRL